MPDMLPSLTLGVEEEYLLVDRDSLNLVEAPEGLMDACRADLQDQVSPEYLRCQIEVGTRVCQSIAEASDDLKRLRTAVSKCAAQFNLSPIAVSCHPFADWKQQHHTQADRYDNLRVALGNVVRRMLICGMHVHVGVEDQAARIDLLPQLSYFLPHLLALSTSSPFWSGEDTGLASYRLSVFDNLPRTGLPPNFSSWAEYERTTGTLIQLGVIEDTTKIWWDLRPSHRFPTLETRIMDVSPRLSDTIALAALVQALVRMLSRLRARNMRWREYDRFLIAENRWRAQRYGVTEGLIDFGDRSIKTHAELVRELQDILTEDIDTLGITAQMDRIQEIANTGTSATRQRRVFEDAVKNGTDPGRAVVRHLIEEFHTDL